MSSMMKIRMRRIAAAVALMTALSITTAVALPGVAQASASKCVNAELHGSCIEVIGRGLNVRTIKAFVNVSPDWCTQGHSQVMIGGEHFDDSPMEERYCNTGRVFRQKKHTKTWQMNRNFPRGTKICAKWWEFHGGDRYVERGNACITVG